MTGQVLFTEVGDLELSPVVSQVFGGWKVSEFYAQLRDPLYVVLYRVTMTC